MLLFHFNMLLECPEKADYVFYNALEKFFCLLIMGIIFNKKLSWINETSEISIIHEI